MLRWILAFLADATLRIAGWRVEGAEQVRTARHAVGVYCHTSAWDGIVGMLVACVLRHRLHYDVAFVMRESLVGPLPLATQRALAVAQVRKGRGGSVDQLITRFRAEPPTCVLVSPEGSRFRTERWHTGPMVLAKALDADVLAIGIDFHEHVVRIRISDADTVKSALALHSAPLYPSNTVLHIANPRKHTSVVDWLVLTSYAMGLSVVVWRGGEAARVAMCCSAVASTAYHQQRESEALRAVDHVLAWLAVLMAFRDYYVRGGAWLPRAGAWGLALALKMASTTGGFRETAQYRIFHSLFHLSILLIAFVS